jgi:methylated-DNA-protein-cysteine methyltransferase-like protein
LKIQKKKLVKIIIAPKPFYLYFMVASLNEKNKDFFEQVYSVVKLIPEGKVTSYGAIANYLSAKRSARMVGWAMNAAHSNPEIPAHRVVNRNGLLTGKMHFSTPSAMQERLEVEGIEIINDEIQNFKAVFWDPEEMVKF